jgi:hypothetical protein
MVPAARLQFCAGSCITVLIAVDITHEGINGTMTESTAAV